LAADPDTLVRAPAVSSAAVRENTRLHLAPPLLCTGATHRRRKETLVMQKKMYKVLTPIQKRDGSGSWFMKVGNGFTNKDDSINLYVDVIPVGIAPGKGMTLQIRELDDNDLRQREASRAGNGRGELGAPGGNLDALSATGSHAASESIPFGSRTEELS